MESGRRQPELAASILNAINILNAIKASAQSKLSKLRKYLILIFAIS
jgi:hypothetical protein